MARYRVLRLITWLPRGGIERKIVAVLPRLDRNLFEAHLCCIRERGPLADELEQQGIPVHVVPFRTRWDVKGLRALAELVKRERIDLIHAHMYRANTPATALKLAGLEVAVVGHYHNIGTWESWRQRFLDRFLANKRDMNLAVSEAVRQDVLRTLQLPEEKVRVLHNGVDLEEFHPVEPTQRMQLREELGLPRNATVVVMAARFVSQKNHTWVVANIEPVMDEHPDLVVAFAGTGPEEARVRQQAAASRHANRFLFLGQRPDIANVLAAADISILPSSREGFSNAILESLACGLPVIASRVGGNAEVLVSGENGFLLDMHDAAPAPLPDRGQFLAALRLLAGDAEKRTKMGQAALATARRFSLDTMVEATSRLYLELLSR
ncbi:MAG: glycosyltransferase [Candidatus Hydrogenedentota bacterium]|nr:MAG: glycosyltransferase [Candidatus Hydrogenedentota bacterium]